MPSSINLILILVLLYIIYKSVIRNVFEGFKPLDNDITIKTDGDNLCTLYASQPKTLDTKCSALTESNCNVTSCCGWLNGSKCVAGNADGPTFRTNQGKPIEVKSYLYQGKPS